MIFRSCGGTGDSDIYIGHGYELVRHIGGFGVDIVSIIYHGAKVHEIVAQDGLQKAMAWCREDARLREQIPEVDFATHADMQR